MKKILRSWFIHLIILEIVARLTGALSFGPGFKGWALSALALAIFAMFLRPLLKILLLPINFLTLGLLRWVINVVGLFLTSYLVNSFQVSPLNFAGYSSGGISISSFSLALIPTYILVSFCLDLFDIIIRWILKK